ncbi:unnamed protein product [Diatraea saccharalis]|nr:unnamed protein product [Diatraea saccharalis]
MKFLVVVIVSVVCAGAAAAAVASSCAHAEEFFLRHNASADDGRETGPICGGQCCGRGREAQLRAALRKNAEHRFKTTITPLMELLLSTRRTLQEHLIELSRESQNKTAGLFLQVYREHAVRAHAPLTNLYDDIRTLLRMESNTEELGSRPPKDLADSSRKFFREIFPVTYQSVLKLEAKQFTPEYEECLKAAYDAVLPFGDIPKQMGSSLSRSLEAARVILKVLAAGASALNASERVLVSTDEECYDKILRVHGCSYCRGYDVKPCKIYCLNVARGCIGSLVAELDAPWDSYTEGLELLTKPDADVALRDLETQVSKAIMYAYALENHAILESKVRQECGTPATFDLPSQPSTPHPPAARRNSLRAPPPYTELLHFAASLARNKRLFAKMTDQLCEAENEDDAQCWNGDSVGK